MEHNWSRAAAGGIVGSLGMSATGMWIMPLLGLPPGNPAQLLAGAMGGNAMLGWAGHLMIGVMLALIYALVATRLPGPPAVRGAIYSLAPWMVAMVMMMPMMGMPMFGGSTGRAMSSLISHLVYGVIVGAIYGRPWASAVVQPLHADRPTTSSSVR